MEGIMSLLLSQNEYRRNVYMKAKTVKKSLVLSVPSAAPLHAQSQVTTSMYQKELLEEKRRQNYL